MADTPNNVGAKEAKASRAAKRAVKTKIPEHNIQPNRTEEGAKGPIVAAIPAKGAVADLALASSITVPKRSEGDFALITDKTELAAFVNDTLGLYADVGERIHQAVVCTLHRAATTGQPALFNKLFSGLRANDQSAVRLYVRRAAIIVGLKMLQYDEDSFHKGDLTSEQIETAKQAGMFMDFTKGNFVVVNGHTSDQAKLTAVLILDRLLNPDGDVDTMVLTRNNFKEIRTVGDVDFLDRVIAIAKGLDKPASGKIIDVSAPVKKLLQDFAGKAETMKNQFTLANG